MQHTTTILLSVLFAFKVILPTQGHVSFEHDITKLLDSSIANVLTKVDSETVWNEFSGMRKYKLTEFKHTVNAQQVSYFPRSASFHKVGFYVLECMLPKLEWNFDENKLRVSVERLSFNAKGKIRFGENESYNLHVELRYLNATINVTALRNNDNVIKLSTSEDSLTIKEGCLEDYFWSNEASTEDGTAISSDKRTELNLIILEAVPQILLETFERMQIFSSVYKTYKNSKTQLISIYPDFATNEHKFYYLIPKTPFFGFYFKRVLIRGLSNFRLLKVYKDPKTFTHTLLIQNITGRLNLDYGTDDEKPFSMSFFIHYLTLSINKQTNVVNANARYYYINGTNGPLTFRQSPVVMQGIESAIASSLMPTMKIERTRDVDLLMMEQIQETKKISDWKAFKEMYKQWIPFNDRNAHKKANITEK